MNVKITVRQQYRAIVDRTATQAVSWRPPGEGWLRTVRRALGMSGAQLARRMGVSRARIAHAEQAELSGGVTLKSMQAAAEAMGCRFVYAVVPVGSIEEIVAAQAKKKAMGVVGTASQHMALERQMLPNDKITKEVESLAQDLARTMPRDFWDDK
jgi:predicted DNA-binding mobile mystery protein A